MYRALFGDQALKEKGMVEKMNEMYEFFRMGKGGREAFVWTVKLAGGILTIAGAIAFLWGALTGKLHF